MGSKMILYRSQPPKLCIGLSISLEVASAISLVGTFVKRIVVQI